MSSSSSPTQATQNSNGANDLSALKAEQMQNAFEQFTRISQNFVSSYQNLEDRVENLADKLALEVANKNAQLIEKERLASRLQSLLSILPSGVVVIDEYGRVNECNKVAIELLGIPLLGEKWVDIIQRSFRPRLDDGFEVSLVDGRRIRIETRALEYEPGQLIVLTDLTKTRDLQDQINQDRRLTSMGRMMAALAHQIRTPLATATLYANSLNTHLHSVDLSPEKSRTFTRKLVNNLGHLERHIQDMLQFAKSGGLKLTPMQITDVASEIMVDLGEHYNHLNVTNRASDNRVILINIDALKSATRNLVDNAKQATAEIKNACIKCSIGADNNMLRLTVSDNGPGISESLQQKVFDPFFTTKAGGTGLGLAVVHGVIKAHSGRLFIDNRFTSGCRMVIDIPINAKAKIHHIEGSCEVNNHE